MLENLFHKIHVFSLFSYLHFGIIVDQLKSSREIRSRRVIELWIATLTSPTDKFAACYKLHSQESEPAFRGDFIIFDAVFEIITIFASIHEKSKLISTRFFSSRCYNLAELDHYLKIKLHENTCAEFVSRLDSPTPIFLQSLNNNPVKSQDSTVPRKKNYRATQSRIIFNCRVSKVPLPSESKNQNRIFNKKSPDVNPARGS